MTDVPDQLILLEKQRADALKAQDRERLRSLLDEDLVHVHSNGSVENLEDYLRTARERLDFLEIAREDLHVNHVGEVAMMTGILNQLIRIRANGATIRLRAFVTQVWINRSGDWRLRNFHATKSE